mgnify:CR=1 FL=1
MLKTKTIYTCQQCDAQFNKWQGQCVECGKWNTIVEEVALAAPKNQVARNAGFSGAGECAERNRVRARNRYRKARGIPLDAPVRPYLRPRPKGPAS